MNHLTAEVAIVGAGPAGLTAASAVASAGVETALIARSPTASDVRTSALLEGSVKALDALGVWRLCGEHAAPLRVMRIVDDTSRLVRAPEVCFAASEIGLDAFGYNVENRFLVAALEARAGELAALRRIEDEAVAVEIADGQVTIRCNGGAALSVRFAIGARRRRSLCRGPARIDQAGRRYPHTARALHLR